MSDRDSDDIAVYTHGYSIRLRFDMARGRRDAFVCEQRLHDGRRWKETTSPTDVDRRRFTRKGSVHLTGRAPRNSRLGMALFNRSHGVRLYHVGVQLAEGDGGKARLYLDLAGVRFADVARVVGAVRLDDVPHVVEGVYQAERYIVLTSWEAWRLSEALGGTHEFGRGAISRKEFLLRDHEVLVTLPGTRRPRVGMLSCYRIRGGATAVWKLELVLKGNRRDGTRMVHDDALVLEQKLRDLCAEHALKPITKPAKWEPVDPDDVWHSAPGLKRVYAGAYRGKKPENVEPPPAHTVTPLRLVVSPGSSVLKGRTPTVAGVSASHIQPAEGGEEPTTPSASEGVLRPQPNEEPVPTCTCSAFHVIEDLSAEEIAHVIENDLAICYQNYPTKDSQTARQRPLGSFEVEKENEHDAEPWQRALVQHVLGLPAAFMSEVILPLDFPPHRLVQAFMRSNQVEVAYLGIPEDLKATPLAELLTVPAPANPRLGVVVVDTMVPRTHLVPVLEHLRDLVERTGHKLVLITGDTRDPYDPVPWDFSSSHDGMRFYMNMRYRVVEEFGSHAVDILKDERHGKHGTRLWPVRRGSALALEMLDIEDEFVLEDLFK